VALYVRWPLKRSSIHMKYTNSTKNGGWTQVLWMGEQLLLHIWHPSCYYTMIKKIGNDSILNCILPISSFKLVKPAHAVTSIKQSPVLKGHLFLDLS
jgi:hypothetical protein